MNRKKRLAMILLVVAIALLLFSVFVNIALANIDGDLQKKRETSRDYGVVEITIEPQGGVPVVSEVIDGG